MTKQGTQSREDRVQSVYSSYEANFWKSQGVNSNNFYVIEFSTVFPIKMSNSPIKLRGLKTRHCYENLKTIYSQLAIYLKNIEKKTLG